MRGGEYVMDTREQAYKDYKKGMKYKEIAEKYSVSVNTVKSWAARYWNKEKDRGKVATKKKKVATKEKGKLQPNPRGAPKGNKNAEGKDCGAPLGNDYALKHGGYSQIYWDTLDEEEKELAETMEKSEEELLIDQIKLFSVRERRLMKAINKYKSIEGNLAVAGVITSHEKTAFPEGEEGKIEKEKYEELRQDKINEGLISYLGYKKFTQTTTEATYNIVMRLERELTAVQSKKTKCIQALAALHANSTDNDEGGLVDDWIAALEDESK